MARNGRVRIGQLRWPVTIATRTQVPDPFGPGLKDVLDALPTVHADIDPIGPLTFYAAAQTDRPVTHIVRMRWMDWIDTTCVIFRTTTRPDGTFRSEVFRVRRVKEDDGRKRFIDLECEQESRT